MSSQLFRFLGATALLFPGFIFGALITAQPETTNVPLGHETYLQVEAQGDTEVSYQWFRGGIKLEDETNAKIVIEAHKEPGEFSYKVEVKDDQSTVMSEEVKLVVFDVAEILGSPDQRITSGPSPSNIYTDMLSEDEPGMHIFTLPGAYRTRFEESTRKAEYITIEFEGSALVEVIFQGGVKMYSSSNEDRTNRDSSISPFFGFHFDQIYANYVLGEGPHSAIIYATGSFQHYRYGTSAIIRRIKIHPLPENNFVADMRRDEMARKGSYTPGDIESLDFDGDGRSNLLEWMQSTDPFIADEPKKPYVAESGEPVTIFNWRRPQNIYPYSFCLEASVDLVSWETVDAIPWEASLNGGQDVRLFDTVPIGSSPRRFLRLKVYKAD